jgi:magnesium transporter
MRRLIGRRSHKAGLPPGTLVHVGERKTETVKITILRYDQEQVTEKETSTVDECVTSPGESTVTWINVTGIHCVEVLEKLGACYGVHPLALEDILNTHQHPKVDDYGDHLFIVLKMVYHDDQGELVVEQVSLVVGPNFVISFQERDGEVFDPVRERIRGAKGRLRTAGADYLAYALVDAVVDHYFAVLERIEGEIEDAEEQLLAEPTPSSLHAIHRLKGEMIFLRKSVWPLREAVGNLTRGESALIKEATQVYLRDVHDHTVQVIDTIESFRDTMSGMLDIYLSSLSNRMNEVMKVLTIIATIFIPVTFIAGVYGMNFRYMPELQWRWGYPVALAIMAGVIGIMLAYFRRRKWL